MQGEGAAFQAGAILGRGRAPLCSSLGSAARGVHCSPMNMLSGCCTQWGACRPLPGRWERGASSVTQEKRQSTPQTAPGTRAHDEMCVEGAMGDVGTGAALQVGRMGARGGTNLGN